jgi:hypothetical protein
MALRTLPNRMREHRTMRGSMAINKDKIDDTTLALLY